MFFISLSSTALGLSTVIVALVSGGAFTLMGVIAHEEYGNRNVAKMLVIFMTVGAIGIFIYEVIIFNHIYAHMAS